MIGRHSGILLTAMLVLGSACAARACPCADCPPDGNPPYGESGLKGRYWATTLVYFAKHKVLAKQVALADELHAKALLAQLKVVQRAIIDCDYAAAASGITNQVKAEVEQSLPNAEEKMAFGVVLDTTLGCLEKGDDQLGRKRVHALLKDLAESRGLASTNALYKSLVDLINQ
jgi:hypothetical protein